MSPATLRILIPIVLIAHGIGHVLGILPAVGLIKSETWHSRSWLLTRPLGDTIARAVGVVIWLAAMLGAIGAGLGAFGWPVTQGTWRTLAVVSSSVSLLGLALFWHGFPGIHNKLGAIIVDVAALVAILWANWPPPDVIT